MLTTFISLLGSLAQVNFAWNGDIVLNVAMLAEASIGLGFAPSPPSSVLLGL